MAKVTHIVSKVRALLPACDHEWSYPYPIRFDIQGRGRVMEWVCKRCGRRQWGGAA